MKPISKQLQEKIKRYRKDGLTHRQIACKLQISLGTVFNYSTGINLTPNQKKIININNYKQSIGKLSIKEKYLASQAGGKHSHKNIPPKYARNDILNILRKFYEKNNRIPTKRDFVGLYRSVLKLFGTWNKAIIKSGLSPNPKLFSKKYIANDGHKCDSLSEKIIDDWLSSRKIEHKRNIHYLNTKFTADFKVNDTFIEFFGLSGELKTYDTLMTKKLSLIKKNNFKIIPLYPKDIFPISNLNQQLKPLTRYG